MAWDRSVNAAMLPNQLTSEPRACEMEGSASAHDRHATVA